MIDPTVELLETIKEIRDLLRLMAEPAIAERDTKARAELRKIVGIGTKKARAVALMDGSRTQAVIKAESSIDAGDLSKLVKQLKSSNLLLDDSKQPKLVIPIPARFFEGGEE